MKSRTIVPLVLAVGLCMNVLRAQEQPKPGPEQEKLKMLLGEWTYEGVGEVTPFFGAAGKFKGKLTNRLVLGGFFVEGRGEDNSDNAYLYQNITLTGYDATQKSYVAHTFENDGKVTTCQLTVSGNTWTTMGSRTDSKGKVYKTRTVETYAADGKSSTEVTEYSSDNGKTWLMAWNSTAKKVGSN